MDNDKIFRVSFRREFIKALAEDYFTFASANLRVLWKTKFVHIYRQISAIQMVEKKCQKVDFFEF